MARTGGVYRRGGRRRVRRGPGWPAAAEGIHTDLYNHELWRLWREQVRQASFWHDNSDVLEEVMRHVRGEA